MKVEQIRANLTVFRYHVEKLCDLEDRLKELSIQLSGNTLYSPAIKSTDEAFYIKGTIIYKNYISDLLDEEEKMTKERNYHLYAVKEISDLLPFLSNEEVLLLECKYWYDWPVSRCARVLGYSKRQTFRRLNAILEKMAHSDMNFVI